MWILGILVWLVTFVRLSPRITTQFLSVKGTWIKLLEKESSNALGNLQLLQI